MINAAIIADSVSEQGKRLMTVHAVYPWFLHGEVMTHRVFSRNASSNRAVPVAKLIAEARSDEHRACPSFSVINAPGMQGGRPTTEEERNALRWDWKAAALAATSMAEVMVNRGGAKQDVNRLLMPYTHARVLISATEWDNFFGLRLHKDAQPEAQELARAIWEARKVSTPKLLRPGEWHLPFIDWDHKELPHDCNIKISVARCARVSYESFETGKRSTVEEDLKLYDRLVGAQPLHASPAEHQATPDSQPVWPHNTGKYHTWCNPDEHGNLVGWRSYRKMLPGEACAPLPDGFEV